VSVVVRGLAYVALGLASSLAVLASAPSLDMQARVEAQSSIERIYQKYRNPASSGVSRAELVQARVDRFLHESAALEGIWGVRVTSEMLQRESERIARETQMPERLLEIYEALGNDSVTIQECLVRPTLVRRLLRNRSASDSNLAVPGRELARSSQVRRRGRLLRPAPVEPAVVADPAYVVPRPGGVAGADSWTATALGDEAPSARGEHGAVWTGSEMLIWGGGASLASGALYDATIDDWRPLDGRETPEGRSGHSMVWTGESLIVWGGVAGFPLNTGARYDSLENKWSRMTEVAAPSGRRNHTAVWTGSEMIVWGGDGLTGVSGSGGRYDPALDSWSPIDASGGLAPLARTGHTAVWSGTEMIVWGGIDGGQVPLRDGSRYDPSTDTWTPLTLDDAPSRRLDHAAVWTGSEMIVWGGRDARYEFATGGRYDPSTDQWTATTKTGAPSRRSNHTAVWSGTEMIVWGGESAVAAGARFDPVSGLWAPMSTLGAPEARRDHTAVWSGVEMIVWGGRADGVLDSGGRYDPATDLWAAVSRSDAPQGRSRQTVIWTGAEMIVWGGVPLTRSGGLFDPTLSVWSDTATLDAPAARSGHSAIWSGSEMIVWGGEPLTDSGGRYDPVADSWSATSQFEAPAERSGHSAVWSGSEMIVWGGAGRGKLLSTGRRYDPVADNWVGKLSEISAPAARTGHTAIWTGAEMLVWGGQPLRRDGAIYNLAMDSWRDMDKVGALRPRSQHSAVWTGTEMIVWGGRNGGQVFEDGAHFNPGVGMAGQWSSVDPTNGPGPITDHSAVWSGSEMIVWGGWTGSEFTAGGARYDLSGWSSIDNTPGAVPQARAGHSAVWSGSEMIVWGGAADEFLSSGGVWVP